MKMTSTFRSLAAGAVLATALATSATAHDFWVQPAQFCLDVAVGAGLGDDELQPGAGRVGLTGEELDEELG